MMRRMLGAPLGGTTRGGHHGVESLALSLITPPNDIGGGGSCFPSSVTVALGEPGTPVICWAFTTLAVITQAIVNTIPTDRLSLIYRLVLMLPLPLTWRSQLDETPVRRLSDLGPIHLCGDRRRVNWSGLCDSVNDLAIAEDRFVIRRPRNIVCDAVQRGLMRTRWR